MGGIHSKKEKVTPKSAVVSSSDNTWSTHIRGRYTQKPTGSGYVHKTGDQDTILNRIASSKPGGFIRIVEDSPALTRQSTYSQRPPPVSLNDVVVSQTGSGETGRRIELAETSKSGRYDVNINSNWKSRNLCNTDFVWAFTSLSNKSSWWFMTPDINNQVERLYQDHLDGRDVGNKPIYIGDGGVYFDFNKMTQKNTTYGTLRYIYRMTADEYRGLRETYAREILKHTNIWVLSTSTEYIIYSPAIQDALNEAKRGSEKLVTIKLNNYDYRFDLENMTQVNASTNKIRTLALIDPTATRDKPIKGSFEFVYT